MKFSDLDAMQERAERTLGPYRMVDMGDGVRMFQTGKIPDEKLQLSLDCLELIGFVRELRSLAMALCKAIHS